MLVARVCPPAGPCAPYRISVHLGACVVTPACHRWLGQDEHDDCAGTVPGARPNELRVRAFLDPLLSLRSHRALASSSVLVRHTLLTCMVDSVRVQCGLRCTMCTLNWRVACVGGGH